MNRVSQSNQNSSSADWKQRYLDLQDQQEKQQARYKRKSGLLVDALVQLIQFGRDMDSATDDKLLAMRGLIRQESFKNVDLAQVVEALEMQLEISLKERKKDQKEIAQQLTLLTKRVQNTTQHRDLQNELNELKKAIEATPIKLATVAGHLGRLSDLHALALKQTKSGSGLLQGRGSGAFATVITSRQPARLRTRAPRRSPSPKSGAVSQRASTRRLAEDCLLARMTSALSRPTT